MISDFCASISRKAKDKQSNTGGENKSAPVSPEGDDIW